MKRPIALAAVLTIAVVDAVAAITPTAAPAAARTARTARTASARGSIVSLDYRSFTILSGARPISTRTALARAADVVDRGDYPYVWGGGHESAGNASTGSRGPGHNGRRIGFDCSGSVAAVLAGAGVWTWGDSVPGDADVVKQLLRAKLIARGPGEVTLFDKPGRHIFMRIGSRYFGTSDGGRGNPSQRHGGAGWLNDGAPDASNPAYRQYHLLPPVLNARTLYGTRLTFTTPSWNTVSGFEVGDNVRVSYTTRGETRTARAIRYTNAKTAEGTVVDVAQDGSSFSVQTRAGRRYAFGLGQGVSIDGGALGSRVRVTYTVRTGTLVAHALSVLSAADVIQVAGTITAVTDDGSAFTLQTAGGDTLTLSTGDNPDLIADYGVGDNVDVGYIEVLSTKIARVVEAASAPETQTVSGTIATIADDGSAFTLQSDDGRQLTFLVGDGLGINAFSAGDSVAVSYMQNVNGTLTARSVDATGY